jgi:hypothetical protein
VRGSGNLEGGSFVKRYQKIIMAMTFVTIFILSAVTLIDPIVVNGQTKEKIILSQESGRDPFLLPLGVHLLSKIGASLGVKGGPSRTDSTPDENVMRVKAILIGDHIRLALIGRHILTVGDSIHGEKVLEIKADSVILGKGEQKRTLLLSQSPVRLTVEQSPRPYPPPQKGSEGGS